MTVPNPRFRVRDDTPHDHPNLTSWAIEEWKDGRWQAYLFEWMPVYRPTQAAAQDIVDRLIRGEDIAPLQVRPRPAFYDWLNDPKKTPARQGVADPDGPLSSEGGR